MEKDSPFSSTGRRCIVTLMCIFVTAFVYAQQQKISVSISTLLHRHGVLALNHSARFPIRTYPLRNPGFL